MEQDFKINKIMTGILNYDTTFQKWEIIFIDKNIYKCPIIERQVSTLEIQDIDQEINFTIEIINDNYFAVLYPQIIKTDKYYFNYKTSDLVYIADTKTTIYNNKLDIIDVMHKDYFMNNYSSTDFMDISLKQFIWIFNTFKLYLNKKNINVDLKHILDDTNISYPGPINVYYNIPQIQLKIDPTTIFTNSNISV